MRIGNGSTGETDAAGSSSDAAQVAHGVAVLQQAVPVGDQRLVVLGDLDERTALPQEQNVRVAEMRVAM